jgi:serine/threonine-protein kinase HipA
LHFQSSSDLYQAQYENHATLEQLMEAASRIENGQALSEELALALLHGSSVGGARPKALLESGNKKYIAKFSSTGDIYPIVQAEYAAMWLADKVGIKTANVELIFSFGKYILLVERFDRDFQDGAWSRKFLTSALCLLNLGEMEGRYASYLELADVIRKVSRESK